MMRLSLALLLFALLGSCKADGQVAISVEAVSFDICECHHGFGFGIDGTANVVVTNQGERDGSIRVESVRLIADDARLISEVTDFNAVAEFFFDDLDGLSPRPMDVAAGVLESRKLSFYFDPTSFTEIEQAGVANYSYEIVFDIDGQLQAHSGEVSVDITPGMP